MVNIICRNILLNTLLLFLAVIPAYAGIPLTSEITDDVLEPENTELSAQKDELLVLRDSIKLSVAIHNVKCSNVAPGSSIVDECRADQGKLQIEVSEYASAVLDFNKAVLEAPKITDTEQAPWLSNSMVRHFLINRDENYTIHTTLIRNMVHEGPAGQKWPDPEKRHERLVDPLDETQELWDHELLMSLDLEKTRDLSLDRVTQIVNERQDAREREAARRASNRMHEEIKKLENEGMPGTGESVIEKEKLGSEFRARLNNILSNITKDEVTDIHRARSLALEELGQIIEARAIGPAKQQRFYETRQEIHNQFNNALDRIHTFALRDMSDEMDRMKQEGYYEDGDELIDKDRNDPHFREAVNEAVRKVLIRQYKAEHNVHIKAIKEIRNAVKILRED